MNANDMLKQAGAALKLEHAKRQAAFIGALQKVASTAEPARFVLLLKIGGKLFSDDDDAGVGIKLLLALATADPYFEPLLAAYREMLRPMAAEALERAAVEMSPLGPE